MQSEATRILCSISDGDRSGTDRLLEIVYDDFRRLAQSYLQPETLSNTLQPTAIVHEAYLKLIDHGQVDWRGRSHFFAVGAKAMRQIIVDHARRRSAGKRGGGRQRITLDDRITISARRDEDVLAIDDALEKLNEIDPQRAKIVELRFFGGLTNDEVAEAMELSTRTVSRQWASTRAWLRRELAETDGQ